MDDVSQAVKGLSWGRRATLALFRRRRDLYYLSKIGFSGA
jgi:hypothetical protein